MSRKPVPIKPESGERLNSALKESGITQIALSKAINLTQQTISKIVKGKANLTEENAKLISQYLNGQRGLDQSKGDDGAIRWEWLFAMDNYKTVSDFNRAIADALEFPEGKRADQLTWACDILLHEAMRKLNLAGGGWQLEDMESGSTVPFTSAQQDEMQRRLQEYAGGLVAHHFIQARINQTELSCAESRGDTVSVAELKKKLQEDI